MVNKENLHLSKRIADDEAMYPLQTRAFFLSSALFEYRESLAEHLGYLSRKGYNTVVVPVLEDGSVLFDTTRDGELRETRRCPGRQVLQMLRDYSFSVWLSLDIVTAGPLENRRLGSLARNHRDWLMKNYQGGYGGLTDTRVPGRFCWTSLSYRRFVGNLLVDIVEGYAIDGLLIDVRNLPRTTHKPESWTHFGTSCLRRVQSELGIDLEELLTQPTESQFQAVDDWRIAQFAGFIENIKARAQKTRAFPICLLARLFDEENPYTPWGKSLAKGIIDEAAFRAGPGAVVKRAAAIDKAVNDQRPYLLALDREADLDSVWDELRRVPSTGYLILDPDEEKAEPLPDPGVRWNHPGAVESNPIDAALTLLYDLYRNLDPTDPVTIFFQELEDYLEKGQENLFFQDVLKVRDDVNEVKKLIAAEEGELKIDREGTLRELDLVTRLLLLTPAPPYAST